MLVSAQVKRHRQIPVIRWWSAVTKSAARRIGMACEALSGGSRVRSTRRIQAMTGHPAIAHDEAMRTAREQRGAGHTDASAGREAALLDELLAGYVNWRESAQAVAEAYARWSFAPAPERAMRIAAYTATLDQEQKTAAAYAEAVADLERCVRRSDSHDVGMGVPSKQR
jgi:hypothetical protein